MHVLDVEEIAVTAPDFVEDFHPFLLRDAIDHQTVCGDGFAARLSFRLHVVQFEVALLAHQNLLAVRGNVESVDFFHQCAFLAVFQ